MSDTPQHRGCWYCRCDGTAAQGAVVPCPAGCVTADAEPLCYCEPHMVEHSQRQGGHHG